MKISEDCRFDRADCLRVKSILPFFLNSSEKRRYVRFLARQYPDIHRRDGAHHRRAAYH